MTPRQMLEPQPAPTGGYGSVTDDAIEAIRRRWPLSPMVAVIERRRQQGRAWYGDELRYCNGRDPRCDLLQELVDAILYAQQAGRPDRVAELERIAADIVYELSKGGEP